MSRRAIPKEEMSVIFSKGLLNEPSGLLKEYRTRNTPLEKIKVPHSSVEDYLAKGWRLSRDLKRDSWLEREKKHQDLLEDDFWCLLYRMGYKELNQRRFIIPYELTDGTVDKKQVDVYGKDDETVLVVECKSALKRSKRSLQKDLAETKSFKSQMATAIKDFYGEEFHPKIVWIYVTRDIIWSQPDIERAQAERIRILTENELDYYDAYIKHMGPAGRYQVLAELLAGEKIPELKDVKVPAVKGKLGKHTYYSFVTKPVDLLKIGFVNHLALNHPDGRPAYQRMVVKNRLKEIAKFIENGGFFPTNLLINFPDPCRFDPLPNKGSSTDAKYGWLYLPDKYKSAWIIDGQHRLYGYSFANPTHWQDDIFVIAFEKMDTATEADLFITINHKQKSVPTSILIALKADLMWGSENSKDRLGAISSSLVKSLNVDPASPLYGKVIMEGLKDKGDKPITIPETVKGLDRSKLLGRVFNGQLIPGPLSDATDDKTIVRARKVLNGYFDVLRDANETRWEAGKAGYLLSNPGVRAHLMLLAALVQHLDTTSDFGSESAPETLIVEKVTKLMGRVLSFISDASDQAFAAKFSRKFGEGGVKSYFFNLCELVAVDIEGFGPDEFRDYILKRDDSRLKDAHSDVIEINHKLMDYVYAKMVAVYGKSRLQSGEERYWAEGIGDAGAKKKAYDKMQADVPAKRKQMFAYLELLDLMKIVRQKENWPHFEAVFNIPKPGEKGKVYYLDWMEEFNELRRVPAHSSSLRLYDEEQYEFLEWLKNELLPRLEEAEANL
jgi:DNA sulfur modification protein DndB